MRRIALAALLLAVLTPVAGALGAGGDPGARQSALRLLETLSVPAISTAPVTTTRTTLRKGATYRLVVTGTIATSFTRTDGVTLGEREDAFYCYDELNEAAVTPTSSCSKNIRYLGALRARIGGFNDHVATALGLKGQPAYQPNHRYALAFRAPRTGRLSFAGTKLPALSPTGSFKLELYGSAAKKKKRVRGCPRSRASAAGVRAATTCHWVVDYEVNQSGEPHRSEPVPGPRYVDSETIAFGKVFFSAEPKAGRTSIGRPAGVLTHVDTYQSPISPFAFEEGEVRMTPLTAKYTRGRGEIRLEVRGVVSRATGIVYSKNPAGHSTRPGDNAGFNAVTDFPLHRADLLQVAFGCGRCRTALTDDRGYHGHGFTVRSENVLRVTISRPRSLAGACRCKA